jgi:hypothetical protein
MSKASSGRVSFAGVSVWVHLSIGAWNFFGGWSLEFEVFFSNPAFHLLTFFTLWWFSTGYEEADSGC